MRHTVQVQVSQLFRQRRHRLVVVLVVAAFAAGCSGGARPTLTGERLVETPDSAVVVAKPVPGASATDGQTAAPDPAAAESTTEEPPGEDSGQAAAPVIAGVERLVVEIVESFPHDATAFTQGLELFNGEFLESTGQYAESDIRRVDPATGTVLQSTPIDDRFFGEGLTRVNDQVIQLTWRENTAIYWDVATLEPITEVSYEGEGWGLCYDGARLIMSDGTIPELIFRDPVSFEETGRVTVTFSDQEVFRLNELECVDGVVWANVWQTDLIVRIDPATGAVTGLVDAINLDRPAEAAVLNGIAWDESTQSFYVTGKYWPTMYRVNFVPAPEG